MFHCVTSHFYTGRCYIHIVNGDIITERHSGYCFCCQLYTYYFNISISLGVLCRNVEYSSKDGFIHYNYRKCENNRKISYSTLLSSRDSSVSCLALAPCLELLVTDVTDTESVREPSPPPPPPPWISTVSPVLSCGCLAWGPSVDPL